MIITFEIKRFILKQQKLQYLLSFIKLIYNISKLLNILDKTIKKLFFQMFQQYNELKLYGS